MKPAALSFCYNPSVDSRPLAPIRPLSLVDPHAFGTFCGLFSALIYTCSNSFLRAVGTCDPVWVSANKAIPTTLLMGAAMAVLAFRGQKVLPPRPMLAAIAIGGLIGQLGGNISFQWALGQIGVALTVPLSLGGMILGAAVLGRVFLGEPVTPKAAVALALLLAAICVLSLGAHAAGQSVLQSPVPFWQLVAGVAAACLCGFAYSILNVILRYCVTRGAPLPATLFTVSFVGLVSLSLIAWLRIGHAGMLATTGNEFALMAGAGICNTIAFIALTKSLQLTSVVYVNALNATQATMAALAGVLIFHEALSPWLTLGVGLTIAGLMVLAYAHRGRQELATDVEPL
jgi:drug/metabolite transporter (DMT)-like permease